MSAPANVAFNPIPYAVSNGTYDWDNFPPADKVLREIREAGFLSVHAEVYKGWDEDNYIASLAELGLAPAPGYFQANFSDFENLDSAIELAKKASAFHTKLGLDRIFIAEQFGLPPQRLIEPAIGADFDPSELSKITEGISKVADAMQAEGVMPCLHPHVGTAIETEHEIDFVLGNASSSLAFGPDTGHLAWAGMDPATVIARYADRVGAVHIKDLHSAVREASLHNHSPFMNVVLDHLWTEPGRGDIDFDSVFRALNGFAGWYVIEVDYQDQPTIQQTAKVSAEWAELNARKFRGEQ